MDVDRYQANLMVALVMVGIAAGFADFISHTAPWVFLNNANYLTVFTRPQLQALAYSHFKLAQQQGNFLTSIWGLWLIPFGVLTIKSDFLPSFLGWLLIVTGVAYIVTCVTGILYPTELGHITKLMMPAYFGEFIVVLWLAFVGARPRAV
jgi:hypothetical protein